MRQQSSEETDVGQVTMNLGRIIMLKHTEKSLYICFCTCHINYGSILQPLMNLPLAGGAHPFVQRIMV